MTANKQSTDELHQLVRDCRARQARMNEWQRELIQSLEQRMAEAVAFTDRQVTQLNLVWDRVTEKG